MAIATGTALAISAGISAVSAGGSFIQAGKQRRLSEQAQRDADKAFKEAEAQLDVNYFEQLGISKTPYDNQREAIAQQAAQAMEIGRESERGGAATAGRVLAQSNLAQQGITNQQTKDLEALNKLVATEDAKLGTARANLGLEQAEGAGFAAAQAQNLQNQAIMSGVTGLANAGMSLYENSELYKQNNPNTDVNTAVTLTPATVGSITPPVTPQAQLMPQGPPPPSMQQTPTLAQQFQNTSAMFNLQNPQLINQNMMGAQQFQNTANNFNSANLLYNPFKVY